MTEATDRELVAAWIAGDRAAGTQLVERHYRTLYVFFHMRVDPDTSADLTQATFVTLCEKGEEFAEVSSIRAYLLGIARWKLVAYFRRAEGRYMDSAPFDERFVPQASSQSLTAQWSRHEQGFLVVEALRTLPLDCQLLMELKDYEGLTAREIAEVFALPPGTVASRLRRARRDLDAAIARLSRKHSLAETTSTTLAEHMRQIRTRAVLPKDR